MRTDVAIWRWTTEYDNSSKRHRRAIRMMDINRVIMARGPAHAGQAEFDQEEFLSDLAAELGPPSSSRGADWTVEAVERGLILSIPFGAFDLLPRIQKVANLHRLNVSAELDRPVGGDLRARAARSLRHLLQRDGDL